VGGGTFQIIDYTTGNKVVLSAIAVPAPASWAMRMTYHVGQAKELGIGMDQIRKAIDVGRKVEKGAMAARRDFSREVLGEPVNRSFVCCADKGDAGPRSSH